MRSVDDAEAASSAERRSQREVVEAFLTASRNGDLQGLLDVLDPEAVVRADATAVAYGRGARGPRRRRGRADVPRPRPGCRLVDIDGYAGLAVSLQGRLRVAFGFVVTDGRISEIELIGDPEVLATLDLG